MTLQSNMVEAASEIDAIERFMAMEWSDGLPVVPPTPERVTQLLDYMGMEPVLEIGRSEVRNRSITAEHVATSAVAAGCRPEYMPIIVSALEGVMDPDFHMNHLASTSSPWPMFIVNGPIIEEIGLNDSTYVLGVGSRANMTIGRAISLTLANCMDARTGGVQLGVMGNGARAAGLVMGEREDSTWEPVSVTRGFSPGTSTVTVISTFEGTPRQIYFGPEQMPATNRAEATAHWISYFFGEGFCGGGTHLVLLPPVARQVFLDSGWKKEDLRRYLVENVRASVASLKRRFLWPPGPEEEPTTEGSAPIHPEDEDRYIYLGQEPLPGGDTFGRARRKADFIIATSGSEIGHFHLIITSSFPSGPNPVTKVIRQSAKK